MGEIRVGISGWTYAGWRGDFYPSGLPQRQELAYAAERMGSVEINGSFYSLQRPTSYASWREQTPDDFVFAVKGGRFVTHMLRLRDVETPLANFFASGLLALGPKLGPVLWQLPERLEYDPDVLAAFFGQLPRTIGELAALARRHDAKVPDERALTTAPRGLASRRVRHALEFRSPSFCTDEAFALLREHDVACVVADTAGRFPMAEAVTSDLVYVRLHGDQELYTSGYGDAALDRWADKCRGWAEEADVVVYFDNDALGFAPHDALRLIERLDPLTR
ncbi:DUF72 domain-containing protein [Nocardioides sp. T2.26MG-1]|uniref:DUF72 domain-containing protein n=1 Tax=Nocardioides sp. T2.26MG-1 TaxID=3041166 RepID=UPI00247732FC|nr:DUF72 domain-containing protein [Nocardioides sp. T2.26MG-1]CAI9407008.1 hypothetical protein HIDPHFAB_04699 [Nocardioides sp. T2.26MG-1]